MISILGYIGRYFIARSLWNATHESHRPARQLDYSWRDGNEIHRPGRGRVVYRAGCRVPVAESPKETNR